MAARDNPCSESLDWASLRTAVHLLAPGDARTRLEQARAISDDQMVILHRVMVSIETFCGTVLYHKALLNWGTKREGLRHLCFKSVRARASYR